jgi:hypothetical protein
MTHTEMELKFFKTFKIGKREYCEKIYENFCSSKCPTYKLRKRTCIKYRRAYPEITDARYLKLCVIYSQYESYLEKALSVKDFKENLLLELMALHALYQEPYYAPKIQELIRQVRDVFSRCGLCNKII